MSGALYVAASGAVAAQTRMEIISNNLANIDTAGYKADRAIFRVADYETAEQPQLKGGMPPAILPFELATDHSPGNQKDTGNPLDLAIEGNGFFCIETPDGVMYTRNGNFALDPEGALVTHDGLAVLGDRGAVVIDGDEVIIDGEGNVQIDGEISDTLRIADFEDASGLRKAGNSLFAPAPGVFEIEAEGFEVRQGTVELSNVDAVETMTEMIETHRTFEAYQKIIRAMGEATGRLINEAGRLA